MKSYGDILRLVWPLALGMINNAVMQFADRAFLSRESMASLEAVLPASALLGVFVCFFQSVVAYSGTFVAQFQGAGDWRAVAASRRAGTVLALVSGALMAATLPVGDFFLGLLTESQEVVVRGQSYYRVCAAGSVFLFLQIAAGSYLTGLGRTRVVFWANLAGNVMNVALDPVLIFGWCGCPRLGMTGAAIATVAATALQWVVLLVAVRRTEEPSDGVRPRGGAWPLVLRLLRYGVPSGAYSMLNLLSFTVFVFLTGGVGEVELAVSNACFTVNYLLFAPMEGFALGASTLVAQAQGRGDSASAAGNAHRTIALGVSVAFMLSLLAVVFFRPILSVFAPSDAEAGAKFLELGFPLVMLMAAWQVFDAADTILSGALKGAGDTKFVMWWMVVCAVGLWLPLVLVVRQIDNSMASLWATLVAYVVVLCVGSAVRWRQGRWKRIRLVEARSARDSQ